MAECSFLPTTDHVITAEALRAHMLTIWPVQQAFQRLVRAYGQTELIQTVWISVAVMRGCVQIEDTKKYH